MKTLRKTENKKADDQCKTSPEEPWLLRKRFVGQIQLQDDSDYFISVCPVP